MLSVAFIVATALARWVKSASVAVALSRIACAKASQSGICASVTPSCDCNVRIRWSTAAWVAAEGAGELDGGAAAGAAGVVGAAVGGSGVADCASPVKGASKAARTTPRARNDVHIAILLSASGRGRRQ